MQPIQTLIELNNIREVIAKYARLADEKNFIGLAELFVPEGTFISKKVNGELLASFKGRKEISDSITESVGKAVAIHHLFRDETILLSPTLAHSIIPMEDRIFFAEKEVTTLGNFHQMHGFGHYHLDFIKVEDLWFIKHLVQTRVRLDFIK